MRAGLVYNEMPEVYADVKCLLDDGFSFNTRELISYKHATP